MGFFYYIGSRTESDDDLPSTPDKGCPDKELLLQKFQVDFVQQALLVTDDHIRPLDEQRQVAHRMEVYATSKEEALDMAEVYAATPLEKMPTMIARRGRMPT